MTAARREWFPRRLATQGTQRRSAECPASNRHRAWRRHRSILENYARLIRAAVAFDVEARLVYLILALVLVRQFQLEELLLQREREERDDRTRRLRQAKRSGQRYHRIRLVVYPIDLLDLRN